MARQVNVDKNPKVLLTPAVVMATAVLNLNRNGQATLRQYPDEAIFHALEKLKSSDKKKIENEFNFVFYAARKYCLDTRLAVKIARAAYLKDAYKIAKEDCIYIKGKSQAEGIDYLREIKIYLEHYNSANYIKSQSILGLSDIELVPASVVEALNSGKIDKDYVDYLLDLYPFLKLKCAANINTPLQVCKTDQEKLWVEIDRLAEWVKQHNPSPKKSQSKEPFTPELIISDWSSVVKDLVVWYEANKHRIPQKPFALSEYEFVTNPDVFIDKIESSIKATPNGPDNLSLENKLSKLKKIIEKKDDSFR